MSDIKRINRWLKENLGQAPDGRALFRMATTDQTEKRWGTYSKITPAGLYLGQETGLFETPKYNWFTETKWALERLVFPLKSGEPLLPELVNTVNGNYEGIHIFPLIDGQCQLPPLRAVQLFIYCLLFGPKQTASDYMSRDREQFMKEVELLYDTFDDAAPWIPDQLHQGHGIVVPTSYIGSK